VEIGSKLALGVGNTDTTLLSARSINDGNWHFVAASRNSGSGAMQLFVDGILDATRAGPAGSRTAPPALRIGSLQTGVGGGFFNGRISDVAVFNQTLNAGQISRLFKAGAGLLYDVVLTSSWDGTNCTLAWPGAGKLVEASDLAGPWTTNAAAVSPHVAPPGGPQRFYRVVLP
jgi:hypothetical protein